MNDTTDDKSNPAETNQMSQDKPSSGNRKTVITPVKIAVNEEETPASKNRPNDSRKRLYIAGALVFTILSGLWLFNYLSNNSNSKSSVSLPIEQTIPQPEAKKPASTSTLSPTTSVKDEARDLEQAKKDAEEELGNFLKIKKAMEAKGVSEWGGELYEESISLSKSADELFIKREFSAASTDYAKATTMLSQLDNNINEVEQRLLDDGLLALKEGNGDRAQKFFSTALLINPENEVAQHNLNRAKNIETVMQLIKSGLEKEREGNLSLAHIDYQDAVKLDPESEEAQLALTRVKNLIADKQFRQLMSSGFEALHKGDYRNARALFNKARAFKPGTREVKDALLQVDTAIRLARIEDLRKQAMAAERSEKWGEALDSYESVLALDASIRFALKGKERSLKYKQLEERMNLYLQKPRLLESDNHLAKAIALSKQARQDGPKGPRFTRQLQQLDRLITKAKTPVPVTIISDSLTDVAVYKVGKLGRFNTHKLNLRPGKYTIVGARDGFKDVRQTLSVNPGQESVQITIKCSEKI